MLCVQARIGKGKLGVCRLVVRRSLPDKEKVPSAIDCFTFCTRAPRGGSWSASTAVVTLGRELVWGCPPQETPLGADGILIRCGTYPTANEYCTVSRSGKGGVGQMFHTSDRQREITALWLGSAPCGRPGARAKPLAGWKRERGQPKVRTAPHLVRVGGDRASSQSCRRPRSLRWPPTKLNAQAATRTLLASPPCHAREVRAVNCRPGAGTPHAWPIFDTRDHSGE